MFEVQSIFPVSVYRQCIFLRRLSIKIDTKSNLIRQCNCLFFLNIYLTIEDQLVHAWKALVYLTMMNGLENEVQLSDAGR